MRIQNFMSSVVEAAALVNMLRHDMAHNRESLVCAFSGHRGIVLLRSEGAESQFDCPFRVQASERMSEKCGGLANERTYQVEMWRCKRSPLLVEALTKPF